MARKTLEEKIQNVIFWTIIFFILYLIVGYLLESSWLSTPLKLNKIYELLKDDLSITAAFLAPVAAFVLFSDWRIQHRSLSNEKRALNLYQAIESLNMNFLMVAIIIQTKKPRTKKIYEEIDIKIEDINKEIQKIIIEGNISHSNDKNMMDFLECYHKLINHDFIELYGSFGLVIERCKILDFPEEYQKMFLDNETSDQFIERQKREFPYLNELSLFKSLKEFRVKLEGMHERLQKVRV